jgi:vancomycin permeability regulator SanA
MMRRLYIGMIAAGGLAVAAVYLVGGRFALEKTVQALLDPIGAIWLFLLCQWVLLFGCGCRRAASVSLVAWCLFTIAGNQLVARWMVWSQEQPFADFRFDELESMPCAVVLGGSTGTTLAGEPQGGDRVLTAIRLWHSNKVERLYASGSQFVFTSERDRHPAEETKLLLIQGGVPDARISLNFGLNTSEEFDSLQAALANSDSQSITKVGIITAASHLPRAMQLARDRGLDPIPIPASFSMMPYQPAPDLVIPSGGNLSAFQSFVHEQLGRLLGR